MAIEYRGVDSLVAAQVLSDDADGFTTGVPFSISPTATISKTTATSSATHYYDNIGMVVIEGKGSDTITITCGVLSRAILGQLTGQYVDAATGALVEGPRSSVYFAIGYRFGFEDGTELYNWRFKGAFSIPDETSNTLDDGTDSTNMQLVYTGISTTYAFTSCGTPASGISVDTAVGTADVSDWFTAVVTPDTITVAP